MSLEKQIKDFIIQEFNKDKEISFNNLLEKITEKIKPSILKLYDKEFEKNKKFISEIDFSKVMEISEKLLKKEKLLSNDRKELQKILNSFNYLKEKYKDFFSEKYKDYLNNGKVESMGWYTYKRFSCNKNYLKESYMPLIDTNFKNSRSDDSYELINLENNCNLVLKRPSFIPDYAVFLNFLLKTEDLTILIKSKREMIISIRENTFILILEDNCYKVKTLTNNSKVKYNDYTFIDKEKIHIENNKITKRKTEKMLGVFIDGEEVLKKVFIKRKNLTGAIVYAKENLNKRMIFEKHFEKEHLFIKDSIIEDIFDEKPMLLETSFLKNVLKTRELFSESDVYNNYDKKTKKETSVRTKNCIYLNIDDKSLSLKQIEKIIDINTLI